ncbi:serine/threonine-protein kinase [Laspinema olomoucense]|uniref:Serine/threonine protein kinase n=1 Tax=Laspinema olomoucense D3b TaxID=2953688 RepID=A0ABT2NFP7_9CYAN|nr:MULTISPECIES: serine/threonine-protein kinase [unclassified Laspinema]MCT7974688.1 serine/threonine protein kinase [Laspinema sp. D3d]MCT7980520.1 serine/threonine protein kinase [Laspinema sp. D3b]
MSYCINPYCPRPADPLNANNRICRQCGSELVVAGRYRIVKLLGTGGFGQTFEVDDRGFPKVLKVLTEQNPKAITLFKQEAAVLQRLRHPGIPAVEPGGYFTFTPRYSKTPVHCLVMEKIQGQNLEEWLGNRNYEPITQQQAVGWLLQLTEILHQVHNQQYFHRDIKPANIMLRDPAQIKAFGTEQLTLIDFGSARAVSGTYLAKMAVGQQGTVISSKGYAPPEQENGKPVPQSDFFGLGRTFVQLLTGKHPLDFYDPLNDELRWRQAAPHISPKLADFIDELMARLPGKRPQSTEVILQRLGELDVMLHQRGKSRGQFMVLKPPNRLLDKLEQWKMQLVLGGGVVLFGVVAVTQVNVYRLGLSSLGNAGAVVEQSALEVTQDVLSVPENVGETAVTPVNSPNNSAPVKAAQGKISPSLLASNRQLSRTIAVNDIKLSNTLTGHSQDVRSVAVTPDGGAIASGSFDGTIKIWNLETGALIRTLTGHSDAGEMVSSVAIAPNGTLLVSSSNGYGGTIKIWNLSTGELLDTIAGTSLGISSIAISPDSKLLASGSEEGNIYLWDLDSGEAIGTLNGHLGTVFSVVFSPDGQTLASASQDGSIKLWSVASQATESGLAQTEKQQLSGHVGTVFSVAFSPNGKMLASGSADNTIKLWDLSKGQEISSFSGHAGTMFSVAFSPDGNTIAGGTLTGRIKLWNLASGELVETLSGHSRWVESIAFSPDGGRLASGSGDRTIRIWGIR